MKLKKVAPIGLTTLILLLSIIVGHFLPPAGILLSPVIISLMTGIIVFADNGSGVLIKSTISYLYIGMNDVGIKLFAGGIHDSEGEGFIHLFLFIGLIPCFIILLMAVINDRNSNKWTKALSVVVFILLLCAHLLIFQTLGMESRYL